MGRFASILILLSLVGSAAAGEAAVGQGYADGHARPRALLYHKRDRLLYVALSTADEVVAIDVAALPPRIVARTRTGPFPQALAPLTDGVLVSCRFDPDLGIVQPAAGGLRYLRVPAGQEHGHRGVIVHPKLPLAYVASPPLGAVKVVALDGRGVVQVVPTGRSPRALLLHGSLLLVANFLDHSVTAHRLDARGRVGPAVQRVVTDAPVQELLIVPRPRPALLLLTHEDRPVDRSTGPLSGLDSVLLPLPLLAGPLPLLDAGPGLRQSHNLTERSVGLLAKLDAALYDEVRGRLFIAGAATDNVLITDLAADTLPSGQAVTVGASPVALALLPDGRVASADRLSDTVSLIEPSGQVEQIAVGRPERPSPAERGELLFYSRALVPHNIAAGPLSVYACSACHDDGHIDGRRHPARKNRFRSMTKGCRGLSDTAPYLSIGELDSLPAFADNIVGTHAQGEDRAPDRFDQYPVTLRLRGAAGWSEETLPAAALRQAMAAYLAVIPNEPSPFLAPGSTRLGVLARRGLGLFLRRCARCHEAAPAPAVELERRIVRGEVPLTSPGLFDVGTPILGKDGNNPPALRGVWDAAPYLSDGSAATLEALLLRTDPTAARVHGAAQPGLDKKDRAALLALLRSL